MDLDNLDTGDILLFSYRGNSTFFSIFGNLIKYFTGSEITHVAMILKDPIFINPSLKGLYIWESGYEGTPDPEDGKIKLGVQITSLHDVIHNYDGNLYIRKLDKGRELIKDDILKDIHQTIYNKPYDLVPIDWLGAIKKIDFQPQKTDRFWCSALVSYILVKLGYLDKKTDWSVVSPGELSSKQSIDFLPCCSYSNDICIN